ncbi:hypothetical protein PFICI_10682 [Pestalotiopsis fici W106-1]|uniref:Major facilitator superfamily (MFS) profile domain-containing protein n=1 Tax=Pestalotiopsis fici (strain W106-1 / CGMCC3.15140) TaxID=1229662 RepID=W3WXQ4_PESFW|nr:uncharacterized protein PFICI_10682 [Pestalotiopsis fici W106-1]ETS78620.1 hypothetical protein PFICI_10682 [Pestalotiopsis fici W106-1]
MGGPVGNAHAEVSPSYYNVPNNTKDHWIKDAGLRKNVFYCIGLCGTLFFNGYDGSLFNGLQTIDAWQTFFDHPTGNTLGLMNSAALFPGLISPYIAEQIATRWGRRWAVWIGVWINIAGVLINSASLNLGMYIAGRAVMGVGISMGLTIAPTLLQEIAHPRYRAPIGTFYTSIYYIAAIISAAVCLATRNINSDASWRIPCYLQLVGPVVTFAMTCTVPESPRALEILAKYHANGDRDDPLVRLEYTEIIEGLETERVQSRVAYKDYLRAENRRRLFLIVVIAIGTNWVGNGIVSYYLSPILSQIGVTSTLQQSALNLGLQIWNFIISTTAGLNCDRIGRRPLWLTSVIGMLFSFVVVMGLSGAYDSYGVPSIGLAVIPFLFVFFGFYDVAWTPLANMYSVEILPFSLRAKGQAIYNIVQGCANAFNQWVNPIVLDAIQWRYYAVYIAILSVYVVIIYFYFPETKNLTIEEITKAIDRESGVVASSSSPSGSTNGLPHERNGMDTKATDDVEHVERVMSADVHTTHARRYEI